MKTEKPEDTTEYTGLEPELSDDLSGQEPLLGGDLREWPSLVVHLFADQQDALRARERVRLRVIRQLRARIWQEAHEISLAAWRRANRVTSREGRSVWRSSRIDTDIDTVAVLQGYERPIYDKISDEIALRALQLELEETQANLAEARVSGYANWVDYCQEAIAIIQEYINQWQV